jgi:hypothetical protein
MSGTDTPTTELPPLPVRPPRRRHRLLIIIGSILSAGALIGIGVSIGASGHTKAAPSPTVTVTATATAPAPTATKTTHVSVTQTATVPPPALTVGKYSGSGDWNSPPFTVNGNPLTVTYSYSGNIMSGETEGDNFAADVENGSDDQSVANTIGTSGGTTTTIYPDTSNGGDIYHLSVQATGSWQFTITEGS